MRWRTLDTTGPTSPAPAQPQPRAYMPPRAPRIGADVMVWSKLQDIVKDHPQLRATAMAIYPAGFVGKWIQGKVKSRYVFEGMCHELLYLYI